MARLRSAPTVQQPPKPAQTREALKDRTNTSRTKAPIFEDDGDTEGLVKDARVRRGRPNKSAQNEAEHVMAGGLGRQDSNDIEDEIVVAGSEQAVAPNELSKTGSSVLTTTKANRRPPRATRKPIQSEAQSRILDDVRSRLQSTARKESGAKKNDAPAAPRSTVPASNLLPARPINTRKSGNSAPDRSEFSLSPSPPPPGKLSAVKRSSLAQPGSAIRQQGTPAHENSTLALKNFKRRPRQPSMLQMVQQRTASARPSAVNAQASEDPSVFDIENAEDDEDDFAPEAEGTPFRASKATKQASESAKSKSNHKQKLQASAASATTSKKRKSDDLDHSSSALDALKAKRQKSTGPEHEEDHLDALTKRNSFMRTSSDRQVTPLPQMTSDVQVINSSPSSTPPTEPSSSLRRQASVDADNVIPSTEKQRDDVQYVPLNDLEDDENWQDVPNDTMAEPASSSPLPERPVPATQRTDVMADPLTQISPPRPKRNEKPKKKAKPLNTATLQALLPKRRQPPKPRHRKSEYDIDSESDSDKSPIDTSHLEEDEDELSGSIRRQTKSAAPTKGRKSVAAKSSKARQSKAALAGRKSSAPPGRKSSAPPTRKKQPKKTYARGTTSDKENEDANLESADENEDSVLPDTSISMHDAAKSKELEDAKKKFADLDNWEMEFESMSVEEGRSSSQAWR